jgi:F420-dependent oxidoreductase-like protein
MRLRIFTEPQQGASYATLRSVAKATEDLGFDAFFRSDHYLRFGPGTGLPGPSDAWATLAGLAVETSRIQLGTLVTSATFRYPGPLAIAVAGIDEMSGGRIELGLGAGWNEREHQAYGIPFPPTRERFDRLDEQLAIITGLWRTPVGETFSYQGAYYQLADSPALPKPARAPHPPVIVGGHGPKRTPALAAAYADEFNIAFAPEDQVAAQFGRVRAACAAAGREPSTLVYSTAQLVCCGKDEATLARRAAAIGRAVDQVRATGLGGSPAEIVDKLGAFAEAGAQTVYLQVLDLDDLDHLADIAEAVLSQV